MSRAGSNVSKRKRLQPVCRLYLETPRKKADEYNVETYMECTIEKTDDDPPYIATNGIFDGRGTTMLEAAINCFKLQVG